MSDTKRKNKGEDLINEKKLYKTVMKIIYIIMSLFFLRNVINKSFKGAIIIFSVLVVFSIIAYVMNKISIDDKVKYLIVYVVILLIIFVVSLGSGDTYMDDFLLLVGVIVIAGLHLNTTYPRILMIEADILLIIMYIISPNKAYSLSTFVMCFSIFNMVAYITCLVIDRGRAYIIRSEDKARSVEQVLSSLTSITTELNKNCQITQDRIGSMEEANVKMGKDTEELVKDSNDVVDGVNDTVLTCEKARKKVESTKVCIKNLDDEVKNFEKILKENKNNMDSMIESFNLVKESSKITENVFCVMHEYMEKITNLTKELKEIASSTTMLSLNASIEAARVGASGTGFAVVAERVQELAEDSNNCSTEVDKVVIKIKEQINDTLDSMKESTFNADKSLINLEKLKGSFENLINDFAIIYENIEEETNNVSEVELSFDNIQNKVNYMNEITEKNKEVVARIIESTNLYNQNINKVQEDTRKLKEISMQIESEALSSSNKR